MPSLIDELFGSPDGGAGQSWDAQLCYDEPEASEDRDTGLTAATPDDALMISLDRRGAVDLTFMSRISGICPEQLVQVLDGTAIFQDPAVFEYADRWDLLTGWLTAPQYLCGDLMAKCRTVLRLRQRFPGRFASNLQALEKRLPARPTMEQIHVSLGAPWVPADIYCDFITQLLDLKKRLPVYLTPELSRWRIESSQEAARSILNNYTYGTAQMSAVKITEATMNARTVKVYKPFPKNGTDRVVDMEATVEAQEKQRKIRQAFDQWIWQEPARAQRLEEAYHQSFAYHHFSPYDGSFLSLSDLCPEVTLYPHQRNAVARILLSPDDVLLCHDVGAGKTYELIVGVHELHRTGRSLRNMVVVPNNVLQTTAQTHRTLYPNDRIVVIGPQDFVPDKRAEALERIRTEDRVATYIARSSFDLIRMSRQHWEDELTSQIRALRDAADLALRKAERTSLRRQADRLARKLADLRKDEADPPWPCFGSLGIQTLLVDEAHDYKNIPFQTRADNVVGHVPGGSAKCRQMLAKCHHVDRVIFATGTPLTNSLADLYAMMTYLQPQVLRFHKIDSFDMWINTFAQQETDYEIDVDTSRLRLMTRYRSFRNLTELMSLFSMVCDVHHMDRTNEDLPAWDGHQDILVPKDPLQEAYLQELVERTEKIRSGAVPVTEDNLLKVTTDGRKCALDIRLVLGGSVEGVSCSKIFACARQVHQLYLDQPGTCQIVFSDIGTPSDRFNVYDCLKDRLEALGIPREQVAFIHEAHNDEKRDAMFQKMKEGSLRVVIGSTAKLGVGVNVQDKLIAIHHLSVPWKPSDITQREGRILRRGNACRKVYLYRYITEGTFDAYSWQILQNKQRFIDSFLDGTCAARQADDIDSTVLSYAEIKALAVGDPLIRERCQTADRLERCRIALRVRQKRALDLQTILEKAPGQLRKLEAMSVVARKDLAHYLAHREPVPMEERLAFGQELLDTIFEPRAQEQLFDTYQGFHVMLPAGMDPGYPHVHLTRPGGGRYLVELTDDPAACTRKLDAALHRLEPRTRELAQQLRQGRHRLAQAKAELSSVEPLEEELERLTARLEQLDRELKERTEPDD